MTPPAKPAGGLPLDPIPWHNVEAQQHASPTAPPTPPPAATAVNGLTAKSAPPTTLPTPTPAPAGVPSLNEMESQSFSKQWDMIMNNAQQAIKADEEPKKAANTTAPAKPALAHKTHHHHHKK